MLIGYENKIGYKTTVGSMDEFMFCNELARFDLGKVGHMTCFTEDSKYYIYNGNECVTKDCYNDNLKMCSLKQLMAWIASKNGDEYLKKFLKPIKAYVNALMKLENKDDIVVIHYGH